MDFGSVSGWVRRGGWFDYHLFCFGCSAAEGCGDGSSCSSEAYMVFDFLASGFLIYISDFDHPDYSACHYDCSCFGGLVYLDFRVLMVLPVHCGSSPRDVKKQ